MGRRTTMRAAAVAAGFCWISLTGAGLSAASGGSRVLAEERPGWALIIRGTAISIASVSCTSARNCAAGGNYLDRSRHIQAFVVARVGGRWRAARTVPGIRALNTGGDAAVTSVSCTSAGNCSAGGFYTIRRIGQQAFVVTETRGTWGKARQVPGMGTLNAGGSAQVVSVSCASAGNCGAAGWYTDRSFNQVAFVVSERNGRWRLAAPVPGVVTPGGSSEVLSVSCRSARSCAAGGDYQPHGFSQPFVVSEKNGIWGTAMAVAGTGPIGETRTVSCGSPGNCSAGGDYTVGSGQQAFVVTEKNGTWGTSIVAPGTEALNTGQAAAVTTMSCASAGTCSAGGDYSAIRGRHDDERMFVVSLKNGRWGKARALPAPGNIVAGNAGIESLSCAVPGNCAAGGKYTAPRGSTQAFVVTQRNGAWGHALEVPGIAALNTGRFARVVSVSCASVRNCSAGGWYLLPRGTFQERAFLVNETNGRWGKAFKVPGF